jgi:hypothetical protein
MSEEEIEKLIARNKELEAQAGKLAERPKHGLEQPTWDVLKFLFESERTLTVQNISTGLNMTKNVADYHLTILVNIRLVNQVRIFVMEFGADDRGYAIAPMGTGFYMKHR